MSIRSVLAALVILTAPVAPAMAQQPAQAAAPAEITPDVMQIPAPDGRSISISVWTATDERGVVVFSHGFNGAPAAYQRLLAAWAGHGFTVIAPLHVDSLQHPDHGDYDNVAAFSTRLMDLAVARAMAGQAHPEKPLIVAGHSFGSLMSAIQAGAVTAAGPMGDPAVQGVIAFSSAGSLPGVVTPDTYATLTAPFLMITGDRDVVPGYVTDWRDHRAPFDLSPAGDKILMVFEGAEHDLVAAADDAAFAVILRATQAFLDAHALNDAEAQAQLDALAASGVTVERR
ncbi:MAG: alpha/beta hydrolase [Brevundimonas sp.]|uniref:alpha/beta hydrolase n=1 Tax=Brevundimonas sp. TaxID=1871086 RepID=UPI00391CC23C